MSSFTEGFDELEYSRSSAWTKLKRQLLGKLIIGIVMKKVNKLFEVPNKEALFVNMVGRKIILENLKVKTSTFNDLNGPILLKSGLVRRLTIELETLELTHLNVTIEGMTMLFCVRYPCRYDRDIVRKKKRNKIHAALEEVKKGGDNWDRTASSIRKIAELLETLTVAIHDMHIRLEHFDGVSNPCGLGVLVKHVSLADPEWTLKGTCLNMACNLNQDMLKNIGNRVVTVDGLAMYCDDGDVVLSAALEEKNIKIREVHDILIHLARSQHGGSGSSNDGKLPSEFLPSICYSVEPVSFQVGVTVKRADSVLRRIPVYNDDIVEVEVILDVKFAEKINILCEKHQLHDSMRVFEYLVNYDRWQAFRRNRPESDVKSAPREWWIYAFVCVKSDLRHILNKGRPLTWEEIRKRRSERTRYVRLYKEYYRLKLFSTARGISDEALFLSPSDHDEMAALEESLTVGDVLYFRSLAEAAVKQEKADAEFTINSKEVIPPSLEAQRSRNRDLLPNEDRQLLASAFENTWSAELLMAAAREPFAEGTLYRSKSGTDGKWKESWVILSLNRIGFFDRREDVGRSPPVESHRLSRFSELRKGKNIRTRKKSLFLSTFQISSKSDEGEINFYLASRSEKETDLWIRALKYSCTVQHSDVIFEGSGASPSMLFQSPEQRTRLRRIVSLSTGQEIHGPVATAPSSNVRLNLRLAITEVSLSFMSHCSKGTSPRGMIGRNRPQRLSNLFDFPNPSQQDSEAELSATIMRMRIISHNHDHTVFSLDENPTFRHVRLSLEDIEIWTPDRTGETNLVQRMEETQEKPLVTFASKLVRQQNILSVRAYLGPVAMVWFTPFFQSIWWFLRTREVYLRPLDYEAAADVILPATFKEHRSVDVDLEVNNFFLKIVDDPFGIAYSYGDVQFPRAILKLSRGTNGRTQFDVKELRGKTSMNEIKGMLDILRQIKRGLKGMGEIFQTNSPNY